MTQTGRQPREHGIQMRDHTVLALLAGRKTQTRRFEVLGPRLYVKEALKRSDDGHNWILRSADDSTATLRTWRWKRDTLPAMYCPRWASRFTIEVTAVREERLLDISEEDALAEGVESFVNDGILFYKHYLSADIWLLTARNSFFTLWDSIYKPDNPTKGRLCNPLVYVYTFKQVAR